MPTFLIKAVLHGGPATIAIAATEYEWIVEAPHLRKAALAVRNNFGPKLPSSAFVKSRQHRDPYSHEYIAPDPKRYDGIAKIELAPGSAPIIDPNSTVRSFEPLSRFNTIALEAIDVHASLAGCPEADLSAKIGALVGSIVAYSAANGVDAVDQLQAAVDYYEEIHGVLPPLIDRDALSDWQDPAADPDAADEAMSFHMEATGLEWETEGDRVYHLLLSMLDLANELPEADIRAAIAAKPTPSLAPAL